MLIVCEAFCGFHLNFRENVKIELGWVKIKQKRFELQKNSFDLREMYM